MRMPLRCSLGEMTANADESKSFGRFILRGVVIALALLLLLIVAFSLYVYSFAPAT